MEKYKPDEFWEEKFSTNFNLKAVGTDDFNEFYNKWLYKSKVSAFEMMVKKNGITIEGTKVLDIGCGTGFWIEYLVEKGADFVYGIDITKKSINKLKERYPNLEFKKVDFGKEGIDLGRKFDLAIAIDVIYHNIDDSSFYNIIDNVAKHLKKGGKWILTGHFCSQPHQKAKHVKARPLKTYEKAFHDHNLKIEDVLPIYFLMNRTFSKKYDYITPKFLNFMAPFLYLVDK
jgi:2-polyprenyl-3-methyl-5-hydroxy-6-metoxy-1,4-benzoquinol methylase